ncbi:MAG TPA: DNA adenine methylase [Micromonosporaceae bacterium]|nr:DNA adenine methylase [Micromonosporaceae bacterium]
MDFYCDRCGYHVRFGLGQAPLLMVCPVCGIGHLWQGVRQSGFRIVQNAIEAFVPHGQNVQGLYQPLVIKGQQPYSQIDFFAGILGPKYQEFIQEETVYLGRFNKVLVPDPRRFSWLSPYTGNKHNQRHFTQAALAQVAIAQFKANGGVFPRLIEPFVGSGQVFLNACQWGPYFNQGIPLFHQVIGGDLNPYVVAAFALMRTNGLAFVQSYLKYAALLDENPEVAFNQRLTYLDAHGYYAATGQGDSRIHGSMEFAVWSYIYVVNRCLHGSKLNANKGVTTSRDPNRKLDKVRERETATLTSICQTLQTLGTTQFACQDFEVTCNMAQSTDIVFMDCPFPTFTKTVPKKDAKNPEADSETANTYGVGDDGASLQSRIVKVAGELINKGTTVILCNFANAGLVRAYTNLLWKDTGIPEDYRRWFTFTYCSPARTSEAYLLTILPGRGKQLLNDVPARLQYLWRDCGGDDNFGPPEKQQFFTSAKLSSIEEPMDEDWDDIVIKWQDEQ